MTKKKVAQKYIVGSDDIGWWFESDMSTISPLEDFAHSDIEDIDKENDGLSLNDAKIFKTFLEKIGGYDVEIRQLQEVKVTKKEWVKVG